MRNLYLLLVVLDQLTALQAVYEPFDVYSVGRVHNGIVGRAEHAIWLHSDLIHLVLCTKDLVKEAENLRVLALRTGIAKRVNAFSECGVLRQTGQQCRR